MLFLLSLPRSFWSRVITRQTRRETERMVCMTSHLRQLSNPTLIILFTSRLTRRSSTFRIFFCSLSLRPFLPFATDLTGDGERRDSTCVELALGAFCFPLCLPVRRAGSQSGNSLGDFHYFPCLHFISRFRLEAAAAQSPQGALPILLPLTRLTQIRNWNWTWKESVNVYLVIVLVCVVYDVQLLECLRAVPKGARSVR